MYEPGPHVPAEVNKYLLPHEQQVITVRQHPAKLLPTLALAFGGVLAGTAVNGIAARVGSAHLVVWVIVGLLLLRALADVASWYVQYMVVTAERVILTSGLTRRQVTVVPLPTLKNLAFTRSAGGRLLGYGAFIFEAAGQPTAVIEYIPYPEQLYLEIYGIVYARAEEDGEGPPGTGPDPDGP
jgi:Bacterial PH domain